MPPPPAFTEVAGGVYVLRHPSFDVNVTLVVGVGEALLVDTLSTAAQAAGLAAAARRVTAHPWTIVNTHHHFDHCLGNATLAGPGRPVWAHEQTAALLAQPQRLRPQWYAECAALAPELAETVAGTAVLAPTRTVRDRAALDIGGRRVLLRHVGRGHTDGDLVVHVPDADVLVAGDLIEQSGPPMFADGYPLEWPDTLAALLRLAGPGTVLVPGHGAVVDRAFAAGQHADLADLARLIRDGHAAGAAPEAVAARAPFGASAALPAVRRGYAQLAPVGPD